MSFDDYICYIDIIDRFYNLSQSSIVIYWRTQWAAPLLLATYRPASYRPDNKQLSVLPCLGSMQMNRLWRGCWTKSLFALQTT